MMFNGLMWAICDYLLRCREAAMTECLQLHPKAEGQLACKL